MAKNDAGEYVDAVMSSQLLTRIGTPVDNRGKKITSSEPCVVDSGIKKQKVAKAKKSLCTGKEGEKPVENNESLSENTNDNTNDIRNTSIDSSEDSDATDDETRSSISGVEPDVEVIDVEDGAGRGIRTGTTIVETLLANLAADINLQFSAMNERMDRLEAGLEKRITQKLSQAIDKRVSSELSKIRKNVDDQVQNVKADIASEFRSDFEQVNDKIEEVASKVTNPRESDNLALNIAIRELPEQSNENVLDKVNKLIKDGLKVADVVCEKAERKVDGVFDCYQYRTGDEARIAGGEDYYDLCSGYQRHTFYTDVGTSIHYGCPSCTCCKTKGCYNGNTSLYNGTWSRTVSGRECQPWGQQTPHSHNQCLSNRVYPPGETCLTAENYCRDPDAEGWLWCYTMDPSQIYEECGIPAC